MRSRLGVVRPLTALIVLIVTVAMPSVSSANTTYSGLPLKEEAQEAGVLFGAAVGPPILNDPQAVEVLTREYSSVTAENEMKWGNIHPAPGVWNFGPADRLVAFAQEHGMAVKGHTFLWDVTGGFGAPAWVKAIRDPIQLQAVIEDHMRVMMTRYKGKVDRWDVVNEPLKFPTPALDPNFYFQVLGPNYIDWAFRTAHAIDPDAKLFLNEVFQESVPTTGAACLALLRSLVAQGTPIDGVGMQMHLFSGRPPRGAVADFVKGARDLGLAVSITEMDATISPQGTSPTQTDPPPPPDEDPLVTQANSYRQVISEFLGAGGSDITTWGVIDKYNFQGAAAKAMLFDDNYQPKPAAAAVRAAFVDADLNPGADVDPGNDVPEVPFALLLPLAALLIGGAVLDQRRRKAVA